MGVSHETECSNNADKAEQLVATLDQQEADRLARMIDLRRAGKRHTVQHRGKLCSRCLADPPRGGQRYCARCHRDVQREWQRKKRKTLKEKTEL